MTATRAAVLARLAERGAASGQALATELGISRAAVGKHVNHLRADGWPVEARPGVGYRLPPWCCPLERGAIEAEMAEVAGRVVDLALLEAVDSTSSHLDAGALAPDGTARLCIAERQHAGRGRRGRGWESRPGASITYSAARLFERAPAELGTLGLAVGIGLAETLAKSGVNGIGLKWPNDLVAGDAKCGGILIDLRWEAAGAARVTVGVGINYAPPDGVSAAERTDLCALAGGALPGRSALAGRLMAATIASMACFADHGFRVFRARWDRLDVLRDRPVRAWIGDETVDGTARGIADDGALLIDTADGHRRLHGGDVSIRARQA